MIAAVGSGASAAQVSREKVLGGFEGPIRLHQVRVAGAEAFASAFEKLLFIEVAESRASQEMGQMFHERKLPDNYPLYVQTLLESMPDTLRQTLREHLSSEKTGLLDTHPAVGARIGRARREAAEGVFRVASPAGILFSDFEGLCRELTRISYDRALGADMSRVQLVPVAVARQQQQAEQESFEALDRYYQHVWLFDRPLGLRSDEFGPVADLKTGVELLRSTRARIEQALPQARELGRRLEKAGEEAAAAGEARMLLEVKAKSAGEDIDLRESSCEQARVREAAARQTLDKIGQKLAGFDAEQRRRLMTALDLLRFPPVLARIKDAQRLREESGRYLEALARLDANWEAVKDMNRCAAEIGTGLEALQKDSENQRAFRAVRDRLPQLLEQLKELKARLETDPYPFEHSDGEVSIGAWGVDVPPANNDFEKLMEAAGGTLNRLRNLYLRLVARLVMTAEKVESLVKLEPLPAPKEEEARAAES